MIVYKNGATHHLFPNCRGVQGERTEVENNVKVCGTCHCRLARQVRANDMKLLLDNGFSKAEIGREFEISRQAVWALVQEEK